MTAKPLRFGAVFLALLTLLGQVSLATGINNFDQKNRYTKGIFKDVPEDKWYYSEIVSAYEYGLVGGQGNSIFHPTGNVTVAEAITFSARINSIYYGKDPMILPTDTAKWYSGYAQYAIDNAIISSMNWEFDELASRELFGLLLSRSLPDSEFQVINPNMTTIPDYGIQYYSFPNILKLFQAGIITGSDEYGRFCPFDNITRAEAAAILNRVANPAQRKTFTPLAGSVSFISGTVNLDIGGSYQLKYSYENQANGSEITWQSSNPNVATVTGGNITGCGSGTTTIWTTNAKGVKNSNVLTVTVSAVGSAQENRLSNEEVKQKLIPSIFRIEAETYTYHQHPTIVTGTLVAQKIESGFFIDSDGTAVVNLHFLDTVKTAKVTTASGKISKKIEVLGIDRFNDLAIIRVQGLGTVVPVELGNSDELKAQETVYYVYPVSGSHTIAEDKIRNFTKFIPEGLENSIYAQLYKGAPTISGKDYTKYWGIDGCPLVNARGQAVGICTAGAYVAAKMLNFIDSIQRFAPVSLETYTNGIFRNLPTFGQSVSKINSATSYSKAYSLLNGQSALMTFSKSERKFYVRYIAPSAGMLYVAVVNKNPGLTTDQFPNAPRGLSYQINPSFISNRLVDADGTLIDIFYNTPGRCSYRQLWVPEAGNYVFELNADDGIDGDYYMHWYFVN